MYLIKTENKLLFYCSSSPSLVEGFNLIRSPICCLLLRIKVGTTRSLIVRALQVFVPPGVFPHSIENNMTRTIGEPSHRGPVEDLHDLDYLVCSPKPVS